MLRITILAVLGALGVLSVMGQGQKVVCPGGEMIASAESVTRGDNVTFHANVTGDFDHSKLYYHWTSNPESALIDGQGTPTVIIDTRNVQKEYATVTLQIGPFSPDCVTIMSHTVDLLAPGNAIGNGRVSGIGSGSLPPTGPNAPLRIISKPKASFTKEGCEARFSGSLWLRVIFLATGEVGDVSVLKGAPYGLNEEAIKAVKHVRFEPAKVDGKPITVTKAVEYTFTGCN